VADRNGPWLAERLRDIGVELAHTVLVADRPQDIDAALRFFTALGADLVITSGGLGPTADDLTTEVVASFQGRKLIHDAQLEERIWRILEPMLLRWRGLDEGALRESAVKQAIVPDGAIVLDPVGTAPGVVVAPRAGLEKQPLVVVLPGPPSELQSMWPAAAACEAVRALLLGAVEYRQTMLRLFGIPESEIAQTLRVAAAEGGSDGLNGLEITTCLRRGEVEVVTRYEPNAQSVYDKFEAVIRKRHADTLFSDDGRSVDAIVADLLRERALSIGTAESCTGGLLAARLTDPAGASEYVRGGLVVYDNDVKRDVAGVPEDVLIKHGAVSAQVAELLADAACVRLGADIGVGITGIAGPDGGSEDKPVGLVWLSVAGPSSKRLTRKVILPGTRADVRDRATTVALHLVRRLLEN
jgi:nicotinamide-nucleotide amidase